MEQPELDGVDHYVPTPVSMNKKAERDQCRPCRPGKRRPLLVVPSTDIKLGGNLLFSVFEATATNLDANADEIHT